MDKDFDAWNEVKKQINRRPECFRYFKEGEVWWCSLGLNVGSEEDGKGNQFRRPILILKVLSRNTLLIVPLTTKVNESRYSIPIECPDQIIRHALISKTRTIDTRRIFERMFRLNKKQTANIREKLKQSFA